MKKLFFLSFLIFCCGYSFPASAALTWATDLAALLVEVSSTLSLRIFLILQDALLPVFVVLSVLWLALYMFSLFFGESIPSGSDIAKNIFNRLMKIAVIGVFFTVNPSFFFDYTLTPLIDLALSYSGEILGATDTSYSICLSLVNNLPSEGLFSPELQGRFICVLEHFYINLMFGVNLGVWLLVSAGASIASLILFPLLMPLIYLKIYVAIALIYTFSSLMIDILWRFIDVLYSFIIGALVLPFSFIGWALKDEESKLISPYIGNWGGRARDLFQKGVIHLIFWCIAISFFQFFLMETFSHFTFFLNGQTLTPEQFIHKDPAFFDLDGSLKSKISSQLAFSFLANIDTWLLLLGFGIFGKGILKKIEGMASQFNADSKGEIYSDLKKAGQGVEKWGKGQIKTLKSSLLDSKKGTK